MITLITGGNGLGKTALALSMALEEKARPLYVVGVKDLCIPHEIAPPIEEWTEVVDDPSYVGGKKLRFTFPPNSLIIIDECQSIYRPRAASSRVPDYVAAFETHRHEGLDFWLITQHPGLLDANVRKLVRRHIHLRDTWAGRKLIEWPELGDPESRASRELAAQRRYKLPRHVFDKYTSAQVHTKLQKRVPWYVYVFFLMVFVFLGLMVYIYRNISAKLEPVAASSSTKAWAKKDAGSSSSASAGGKGAPLTRAQWVAEREPRLPGIPHTAPVYDKAMEARVAPFPSACVVLKGKCGCYTDQATRLHLPDTVCRDIVANGFFNPTGVGRARAHGAIGAPPVVAPVYAPPVAPVPAPSSPAQPVAGEVYHTGAPGGFEMGPPVGGGGSGAGGGSQAPAALPERAFSRGGH